MADRQNLFVFNSEDKLLCVTKDYITAIFEENVSVPVSLTIEFPLENEDAEHFKGGNQVAFRDLKNRFRLFTIREADDEDGSDFKKTVYCLPALNELSDVMIEERRPQRQTADYVLSLILATSRWKVGNVADLGTNSTSFYYENALVCLQRLTQVWGGEVIDRIEINNNRITDRYIDIVYRKGSDTGKRFEVDKDIERISRTVLFYPKTALYGKGSSVEQGEGYSRKITFAGVEYATAKGDPFNKPYGQEWVGDPEAKELYGIPLETGEKMHRYGMFEDSEETDPEQLLLKTWNTLQEAKLPKVQYQMSIYTFYGIAGYEHEAVYLGDTGILHDSNIKPHILIESRVMSLKYDLGEPENGEIILGNILEFRDPFKEYEWAVEKIKDKGGIWDKGGEVDDSKFPDTKPPAPTGVTAEGLFRVIQVAWDYRPDSYIASYEVFASQTNNFIPDITNRVFRGKTGGYIHHGDTNETWYFRVRAVNYHGTASDYSPQASGTTVSIEAGDITPKVITNELIAENAEIDFGKIANVEITNAHITGVLEASKIAVGEATQFEVGYNPKANKEEIDGELDAIGQRVNNAEIQLQPENITSTVTEHENFQNIMGTKADTEDLANYTPVGEFEDLDDQVQDLQGTVDAFDLTPYVTETEMKQESDNIKASISRSGGVNLIRNSVGYADFDYWTIDESGISVTWNDELDSLGFGRGFYCPKGTIGTMHQTITVTPHKPYSFSMYVKKTEDAPEESCARVIIYDGETEVNTIGLHDGEMAEYGYEVFYCTCIPQTSQVTFEVLCESNCEAVITGLMMNYGEVPLPWTPHKDEHYNTNVRVDLNGLRVVQEGGATIMTPEKFGGYYDVNGDGTVDYADDSPDEVFRMDKDEFKMKKATVKEEITMGNIKIIPVDGGGYHGWAFVPTV